jgi:hydrogenase maturation protein HypF
MSALVSDIDNQTSRSVISRRFHTSIARSIAYEAMAVLDSTNSTAVVLSGGVLLNEFLSINISSILQHEQIPVYIHTRVPTNDGGISVGQVGVAAHARVDVLPAKLA